MKLDAHWMPFTANKTFKQDPILMESSSGMHVTTEAGQTMIDMTAGLWCTNLGHSRERVAKAMYESAKTLGYVSSFNLGHRASFELAERLTDLSPGNLNHVFFSNSGSEAIDTALKIAMAYHAAKGQSGRKMFIARERAYHGVNLGGTAVGGLVNNTRNFGRWGTVAHLPHTLDHANNAFSRGLPKIGAEKAQALADLIALHGAENIAAVMVEPIAGAGGVLPPPVGYLKELRKICDEHDILLIFDEVVTGFGRTGSFTASIEFDVVPDIYTSAKGLTSGAVPMGATFCKDFIYDAVVNSVEGIEFWHGYTYSAHPIACAAAIACLDIYEEESLFTRVNEGIGDYFEEALHSLNDLPHVIDIRNYGLLGAIEFQPQSDGLPMGSRVYKKAMEKGVMVRGAGDSIILSPPLIIERSHIDEFVEKTRLAAAEIA
ncbi:aminotransferase class III-fold pyridoxal phosphate-dependent enzyme [Arenicella xantha]|uniref:Beta-alanine--pyruvate transaminase n=1 Tax=Arenicella xantha TaxID=644221 RepID=A0A395JMZ1_9GAMM|nr:aminotransferase class III-fold pyridoxal phosphate-dependent enzyme [Arenicella xantha]RBP52919.1 beta-alanine--pyruvate transaminase [Arenicella xantha]